MLAKIRMRLSILRYFAILTRMSLQAIYPRMVSQECRVSGVSRSHYGDVIATRIAASKRQGACAPRV